MAWNKFKIVARRYVIIGAAVCVVLVDSVSRIVSMLFDFIFVAIMLLAISWK